MTDEEIVICIVEQKDHESFSILYDRYAEMVTVSELADSSVNLAVRPWCDPADYWDLYFGTLENCKLALDYAGVIIPFPQVDVHMINQ